MYSTNSNAFELAYQMTTDGIGIFVKSLKDFTPEIKGDEYAKNFYLNNDDMYLWIALEDKTDGQIFGENTFETDLPLTMNCYYDYATDLTLNMEMDIEISPYHNE